jgi:hypothetical protein
MRRTDIARRHLLTGERPGHALAHEIRKRRLADMLELAAAAFAEVSADRNRAVRPGDERSVGRHMVAGNPARDMATVGGYAVAARGDADNQVGFGHG